MITTTIIIVKHIYSNDLLVEHVVPIYIPVLNTLLANAKLYLPLPPYQIWTDVQKTHGLTNGSLMWPKLLTLSKSLQRQQESVHLLS